MLILSFIFFYTFSASVLFLHGIGLERLSMNARSAHVILPFLFKSGILITGAASISWLLGVYLLDPFGLSVLTPLVSLIITYLGERAPCGESRIPADAGAGIYRWHRTFCAVSCIQLWGAADYHYQRFTEHGPLVVHPLRN